MDTDVTHVLACTAIYMILRRDGETVLRATGGVLLLVAMAVVADLAVDHIREVIG